MGFTSVPGKPEASTFPGLSHRRQSALGQVRGRVMARVSPYCLQRFLFNCLSCFLLIATPSPLLFLFLKYFSGCLGVLTLFLKISLFFLLLRLSGFLNSFQWKTLK